MRLPELEHVKDTEVTKDTKGVEGSFGAEGQEMPAETPDEPARQQVERADEDTVVDRPLPAAVQAGPHRKPLRHDASLAETAEETSELADAELEQHRGVLVLETHLHDLGECVQPRHAVVDLEDRLAARL